jgi:chitinase
VTVGYATEDGTAHAGSDYTAGSGRLTFQSGAREQTIAVAVIDDSEEEGSETFTVRLSDARNATLLDGEGTATIRDDDGDGSPQPPGLPTLAIDDVTVAEDGGSAVFGVRLSGESTATVTVEYATEAGTAEAGTDYTARSGTLVFLAGETEQTIAVPVVDDNADEITETFTMRLSEAHGATLGDREGTATIRDDDGPPAPPILPELEIDDVTVDEDGGSAVFRVSLSKQSTATVTVEVCDGGRDGACGIGLHRGKWDTDI